VRRRAAARAAAWLAFARESYDTDPRGVVADSALGEGARLVTILEREMSDSVAASLRAADGAPLVAGALRVRDDLWALAETLRGTGEDERAAEAEVLLVRAGLVARATGETPPGAPTCGPWSPLARAERLLHEAMPVMAMSPRPPRPVVLMVPMMDSLAVDTIRVEEPGVQFGRGVHFALDSDTLSAASRRLLDGVVVALAARGDVELVLEGHTDPRGRPSYNDSLSRRRADAVQAYLTAAGLQPRRVEVRALGKTQRATLGSTFMDYAVDRRVVLRFYEFDGRELTADDLRDVLQLEVVRTRVRRIRLPRSR
jgi:outer membrane protein OmpA-like peptidoglycan-associated protein